MIKQVFCIGALWYTVLSPSENEKQDDEKWVEDVWRTQIHAELIQCETKGLNIILDFMGVV